MLTTLAAALIAPPVAAKLGQIGVKSSSEGEESLPFSHMWIAGQLGSLMAIFMAVAGLPVSQTIIAAILLSLLAVGAYVDRQSGWAPDHLILPASVFAMMSGAASGAWDMPVWYGAFLGLCVYLAVQGLWILSALLSEAAKGIPPGDILALAIPVMALGFTKDFVICMMLISSLLAIVILVPKFGNIFSKKSVADTVRAELGREDDTTPVVTFLTIGFPAAGMAVVANAFV